MNNKYIKIYDELVGLIQEGNLKPNTKLPSENELRERYQTTRETIRKALHLLSEHGYIQKVQGKGSIILDVKKFDFPISGLVSFKELASKMGQRAKTTVENLDTITPSDYLKEQLKLKKAQKVWEVIRVRDLDGEKVILDKDYFNKKMIPTLTKEVCENSIYEYIEGDMGLAISFAKKEITVEEPTEEDHKYLHIKGYSNIVVVKNYVYLDDASLFQYTESRHRPDKFRFVDFARRK
ncbi:trehalose operon repressor [Anaerobacillus alkalidiazotrophicus]|uniref:Trehalose operon repressor n=1 Tax=Anaerobacillus alkalidiazotrophicus TaxID=472963 RepID=A0A1S2MC50_9BACI|nr:trehalose operon repressor [Anaerobacillus alkalidiazotrophicus]OIJ21407.1 trehalose operon repressor [Anaerobacillus alkalidiazotrophicus]